MSIIISVQSRSSAPKEQVKVLKIGKQQYAAARIVDAIY